MLSEFMGDKKCMLIVNVASKWPFAKRQYKGLVKLDETFRDRGLVIVGFPCNQFQGQEPKSCNLIIEDVRREYGVKFQINEKLEVNGPNAHPIFVYLRQNTYELRSKNDANKIL